MFNSLTPFFQQQNGAGVKMLLYSLRTSEIPFSITDQLNRTDQNIVPLDILTGSIEAQVGLLGTWHWPGRLCKFVPDFSKGCRPLVSAVFLIWWAGRTATGHVVGKTLFLPASGCCTPVRFRLDTVASVRKGCLVSNSWWMYDTPGGVGTWFNEMMIETKGGVPFPSSLAPVSSDAGP